MTTDTADHGHARRKSDSASHEPAFDEVIGSPAPALTPSRPTPPFSRVHDSVDDGTPEGDEESDASEADEIDDPDTTPVTPPPLVPTRTRRRDEGTSRDNGNEPRRRRSDEVFDHAAEPRRPRGRRGWIAATIVFVLLFGGAAALDWYLWNTTEEWEERSESLMEINYDLGARLSSEQQTTLQLTSEIDLLTQQLATSNSKVTALSAEKANAVDESAYYLQQIEALETDVSSAASVANALHRCVDGQQELVTYLGDPESYEAEELEDFSTSVRELCAEAESANERLQETLSE